MKFGVISLTTEEILKLSKEERDFLLASSFIRNDIRFYWSLLVRSPTDGQDDNVKVMQTIRWLWCSRKLASVIFESDVALAKFSGKLPLAKEISKKSPWISRDNRKSPMFKVAREMRKKTAYHYDPDKLGEALSRFKADTQHRLFEHCHQGNGISEIGEQIFTLQLLHGGGHTGSNRMFDQWINECSNSVMKYCAKVIVRIILQAFPNKSGHNKMVRVSDEGQPLSHRWPLFLSLEQPNSSA